MKDSYKKNGRRMIYLGLCGIFLYGLGSSIPHAIGRYLTEK
jgi:hypothetical protein